MQAKHTNARSVILIVERSRISLRVFFFGWGPRRMEKIVLLGGKLGPIASGPIKAVFVGAFKFSAEEPRARRFTSSTKPMPCTRRSGGLRSDHLADDIQQRNWPQHIGLPYDSLRGFSIPNCTCDAEGGWEVLTIPGYLRAARVP